MPLFDEWNKFRTEILERFEPKEGALIAKQEMDALRYTDDIAAYIDKIRTLNHRVGMKDIILRSMVLAVVTPQVRFQILQYPETNNDDLWLNQIIAIGRTIELRKRQDKLLKGEPSNPKPGPT